MILLTVLDQCSRNQDTQLLLLIKFKSRSALPKNTIKKIFDKSTLTGYLGNNKKPKRSDDNIERERRSIEENPTTSPRRRSV